MTKADEMRKMAAQNKKTKTEKVDDYEETLNKTYAKFICTVEDSANKGISKGYAAEIPRMLVPGKYTFEWKNKGLFTDYYVAKMTSLGERFLKDFKAKAEKDGFKIEYKLCIQVWNIHLVKKFLRRKIQRVMCIRLHFRCSIDYKWKR